MPASEVLGLNGHQSVLDDCYPEPEPENENLKINPSAILEALKIRSRKHKQKWFVFPETQNVISETQNCVRPFGHPRLAFSTRDGCGGRRLCIPGATNRGISQNIGNLYFLSHQNLVFGNTKLFFGITNWVCFHR